ncbi:hypothetical protein JCM11641_005466 [Rhodosporidiobolus odoratus]
MLTRTLFVTFGCAFLASAQLFGSEDGTESDFPSSCTSACDAFETAAAASRIFSSTFLFLWANFGTLQSCTMIGDSPADEASSFACVCTDANARSLESCASCIISAASDPSTSESAATAQQLAISFTRGCGMPLNIDGVSAPVSSVLADGGSEYASERSSLWATEALYTTESNGMAVTLTMSTTAAPSSQTGSSSASVSSSASAAASASETSQDSGATALRLGSASLLVAVVVALAV